MSAIAPRTFLVAAVLPALDLLPTNMTSAEAKAMLLAIALQETAHKARRQEVYSQTKKAWVDGPARSHFQFELGGLAGVLRHPATQPHAARFASALGYADATPPELLDIMVYDSVLAAGMARLNLFWDAQPLPRRADGAQPAYDYYDRTWRPGKKRPLDWPPNWQLAWDTVA